MTMLTVLEITVATATPTTSRWKTITKSRFRKTLSTPPAVRQKRGRFVSGGPKDGGGEIVEHEHRHAGEIDPQVDGGQVQHVIRSFHEHQERTAERDAEQGEQKAADEA